MLTHWGQVTHICVSKLTIIGSDNRLSPGRRQAIIWTNAGKVLIGPLATNFSEMLIEIHSFSLKKMRLKMASGKWRPFCLGLNVLITPKRHLISRDNFVHVPGQWETMLLCNVISHWLDAHTKWSLHIWPSLGWGCRIFIVKKIWRNLMVFKQNWSVVWLEAVQFAFAFRPVSYLGV